MRHCKSDAIGSGLDSTPLVGRSRAELRSEAIAIDRTRAPPVQCSHPLVRHTTATHTMQCCFADAQLTLELTEQRTDWRATMRACSTKKVGTQTGQNFQGQWLCLVLHQPEPTVIKSILFQFYTVPLRLSFTK